MSHTLKISKHKPSILQGTLQFEVGRPGTSFAYELAIERRAFSILGALLVALIAAYLYFVASSILNVIGRADADRQAQATAGDVAELEQRYLALSQSVTQDSASELGLAPVQAVGYVYRPGNAAVAIASRGDR